jgi:hypothetical protein
MTRVDPQEGNVKGMIAGAILFGMSVVVISSYYFAPIDGTAVYLSIVLCPLSVVLFGISSRAYERQLNSEVPE